MLTRRDLSKVAKWQEGDKTMIMTQMRSTMKRQLSTLRIKRETKRDNKLKLDRGPPNWQLLKRN